MGRIILISFCAILLFNPAAAEEDNPFRLPDKERADFMIIDKKTSQVRAHCTYLVRRSAEEGHVKATFYIYGKGSYYTYNNIRWISSAEWQEDDAIVKPLHTHCTIYEPDGETIISYEKDFDYAAKRIYWKATDGTGRTIKKAKFPIKGNTADDVILMSYLRPYAANSLDKNNLSFYLITNEPRLYKMNIVNKEQKNISLPAGKIEAIKLRLRGNLGIVDDMLDAYFPSSGIWYSATPPFKWLQFDGPETGLRSTHIIAYLTEGARNINNSQPAPRKKIAGGGRPDTH